MHCGERKTKSRRRRVSSRRREGDRDAVYGITDEDEDDEEGEEEDGYGKETLSDKVPWSLKYLG